MGVFYVDCSVANMAERDKSAPVEQLLVDTGSEYTWLPGQTLAGLGIAVEKPRRRFVMANEEIITRDVGYAILKVNGFETVDEIVFADNGDLNLLGSQLASTARTNEGIHRFHRVHGLNCSAAKTSMGSHR